MSPSRPSLEFWFDFASTYSYLSAMRIGAMAEAAGVEIIWKPFLLGPIFAAQGWNTSPFAIYPAKGRYMWRDVERRAEHYGLPFARPSDADMTNWPRNSVYAARLALVGLKQGWGEDFIRALFTAEFGNSADVADPEILSSIIERLGVNAADEISKSQASDIKELLRNAVTEAESRGIFGAPTCMVGDEMFWGDDRLEEALCWAEHKT